MDAYDLHEARFVQIRSASSAAGGLSVGIGPVPEGKIWTILCAGYYPSVSETKVVWYALYTQTINFPVTVPQSWAATGEQYPALTEGMELKLYPGEYLYVYRASATAGSTMTLNVRFIESDMPLYEYVEPQERKRESIARSTILGQIGGGGGRAGSRPARTGPPTGPRGRGV